MPLFDQIVRVERRARRQNESGFDYINSSARPGICAIRDLLEHWFERLPDNAKADIGARFRSRDEVQHQSAWFELLWHELLRCSGYDVDVHPALPDVATNPDFLAKRNGFIWRQHLQCPQATLPLIEGLPNCTTRWIG